MDCEKECYKEQFILLLFISLHVEFLEVKVNDDFCFDISIVDLNFFICVIVKHETVWNSERWIECFSFPAL